MTGPQRIRAGIIGANPDRGWAAHSASAALPQGPGPSTNVAQANARFARDCREGTHLCPTFDDAVTRHRMLDAIERAAATGQRQSLG
jgi:predicted dehydrogenase